MLIAICSINRRQHCVGVWATLDEALKDLLPGYTVEEIDVSVLSEYDAFAPKATRAFDVLMRDERPEDFSYNGSEADGFVLYEYGTAMPGYLPFDED